MPRPQHVDTVAAGRQLLVGHRELRAQLAAVRAALDAAAKDESPRADEGVRSQAALMAQLRARCLDYCLGLHHHHTMEDGAFPLLERERPEIAPVVARLREEHRQVAAGLERMRALLATEALTEPGTLREELERTVESIEEHFRYEETDLLPALGVPAPETGS
jgi:hypothetical protein